MSMKICSKCSELKELSEFTKVRAECKVCINKRSKSYFRTKGGLITRIYSNQISSSKTRKYSPPSYVKQELKDWLLSQEIFHELYYNWKASGYEKLLAPSCNRINDYKGYSLDNIELITWEENNIKYYSDKINGINNKNSKSVISICKITIVEVEYHSIRQAERETGTANQDISKCCLGKRKSAGGYYWRFKN